MKALKDDNEARLYGRFYARLSKYPEIKAIYAQTDEQERSEYREGVIKALCVAFDLFCALTEQARELNALRDENRRLIETFFVNRGAR